MMDMIHECFHHKDELVAEGLFKNEYVPPEDWIERRGIFDVDGDVHAWGLLWRLGSGSVVFKVDTPYCNEHLQRMKPWVHYVPIALNMTDLEERTKLVMDDRQNAAMAQISASARALAEEFGYELEVERVARQVADLHLRVRHQDHVHSIAVQQRNVEV